MAPQKYTAAGWTARLIWVVGTQGLVNEPSLHDSYDDTLKFLDIPCNEWSSIAQDSLHTSAEALAFMYRLCFS